MENILNLFSDDVIVAPATPTGRSALAIIRSTGKNVFEIFQSALRCEPHIVNAKANRAIVVSFETGDFCDKAVALIYRSPKSYTGENMVEFSVHGNPTIVRKIIDALISNGARLANPGEFTFRAAMNGKMNIVDAEAISATIQSQTERALAAVKRATAGIAEIARSKSLIHNTLIEIAAALEFSEDELPRENAQKWIDDATLAMNMIKAFLEKIRFSRRLFTGITVVVAGEPNAGKSTLFNRIVGAERAIVTPHPGTTRDIIEATVEISGVPMTILDTAGLRDVDHPIEEEGVRRAERAIENADAVIWMIDGAGKSSMPPPFENSIVVLNKSDIGISQKLWKEFPKAIAISALTGEGFGELMRCLQEKIADIPSDAVMISARTENVFCQTADELSTVIDAMQKDFWDVAQVSLERADNMLESLFSLANPGDIYDEIFSKFCIGK